MAGKRTYAVLAVATLLLTACTSVEDVVQEYGEPDMTYEAAGDLGRYYVGGDPGEYVWRWHEKVLYYFESDSAYVFRDNWLNQVRRICPGETRSYHELLSSPHDPVAH